MIKKGLIFSIDKMADWAQTHAQVPTVDLIGDRFRIYFSTRDSFNRSLTSYIEVSADNPKDILYVHDKPILDFGKLGCFDDCGVMPSYIMNVGNKKYMYYCGWNTSTTVRYRNCIGLAQSEDGGETFSRMFDGPIMDRTKDEPHLVVTPCLLFEDGMFKMWYCGGTEWKMINGVAEPQYLLKYAESHDGIDWIRPNRVVIPYKHENEAIGRPSVIHDGGIYKMWYCYRDIAEYRTKKTNSYKIGYAESADNITWVRKDEEAGLTLSEEGWDSEMQAYPYVVVYKGKKHLFYNGNGFGKGGFGYAIIE
ncbi:MAG: hypothetical protein H0W61_04800 [Bacteroidetes bacterium]|nr:hypothetical protein [Bacteroidota bacterium]